MLTRALLIVPRSFRWGGHRSPGIIVRGRGAIRVENRVHTGFIFSIAGTNEALAFRTVRWGPRILNLILLLLSLGSIPRPCP